MGLEAAEAVATAMQGKGQLGLTLLPAPPRSVPTLSVTLPWEGASEAHPPPLQGSMQHGSLFEWAPVNVNPLEAGLRWQPPQ